MELAGMGIELYWKGVGLWCGYGILDVLTFNKIGRL